MVGAASPCIERIERVLAGVFVLRDAGGDEVDRVVRQALARYRGPDLGIEGIFPSLPGFIGMHMGAPHWMGRGLSRDGARILSISPYVRLDFVPDVGVQLAAMCEEAPFARWLDALRAGTGWP